MAERSQLSFTGGVIAPELVSRTDLAKVRVGVKALENMLVQAHGSLENRPGTRFMIPCIDQSNPVRLIPFEFSEQITYVLEFGHTTVRAHSRGGTLLAQGLNGLGADGVDIISTTEGTPPVVNATAHGLNTGDYVWIIGSDALLLNETWFRATRIDANQITLQNPTFGDDINGTGFGVGTGVGKLYRQFYAGHKYHLYTPDLDLFELGYTQSADTLTITHDNPVLGSGDVGWSVVPENWIRETEDDAEGINGPLVWFNNEFIDLYPLQQPPTENGGVSSVVVTKGTGEAGQLKFDYCVTSVSADGEESEARYSTGPIENAINPDVNKPDTWHQVVWNPPEGGVSPDYLGNDTLITGVTNAFIAKATFTASWLDLNDIKSGDIIRLGPVTGMEEISLRSFILANVNRTNDTADLAGENSTPYDEFTGTAKVFLHDESDHFNIYKSRGRDGGHSSASYGFIGTSRTSEFYDNNVAPLSSDTPPIIVDPFNITDGDGPPGVVAYIQQRRVFAATRTKPNTVYMSQPGLFHNFSIRQPIQDDDAITFTINAGKINKIRHIVPLKTTVLLSEGGEWVMRGDQDGVISPLTVSFEQHGTNGSSKVPPIIIGDSILYIGPGGDIIRDLYYDFTSDNYKGNDITILSRHLFEGRRVVDWSWQKRPDSIVWCVLDDGTMVSLTYLREHEVWAWAHHSTNDDRWESVSAVAEGAEYGVYFVVRRRIQGQWYRFIENLASRNYRQAQDAYHLDAGLSYNKPISINTATQANPVKLGLAPDHGLVNGDTIQIEDVRGMTELNGTTATIANVSTINVSMTFATPTDPVVVTIPVSHGLVNGDTVYISGVHEQAMIELNNTIQVLANVTSTTAELEGLNGIGFSSWVTSTNSLAAITVELTKPDGSGVDGTAFNEYLGEGVVRKEETTFIGFWHLEGETVDVVVDGAPAITRTVTDGRFTLEAKAARVHAGRKYNSDVELLKQDFVVKGGSVMRDGTPRAVGGVHVRVESSRPFQGGPDADNLDTLGFDSDDDEWGTDKDLKTGVASLETPPDWSTDGNLYMRQSDALPLRINSVTLQLIGDMGGEE